MNQVKLILACLLVMGSNHLFAQLAHPHFVSLNVGTNIPLSEYGKIDSLSSAGANQGLYYSFEGGAYFSRLFGVGVNVGAFNNPVDNEGVVDQLKTDTQFQNGTFNISSKSWTNGYIMMGPYFSFGSRKFTVDMKVLGGIINSERPFINIESETDRYEFNSAAVYSTSFGVNYGIHFRIKLKGKLALRLNAEGMLATQDFTEKITEVSQNGTEQSAIERTSTREISALNLGAGVMINF